MSTLTKSEGLRLPQREEKDATMLAEQAQAAMREGDFSSAVRDLRSALKLAPFRPDLKDMLTAALERRPVNSTHTPNSPVNVVRDPPSTGKLVRRSATSEPEPEVSSRARIEEIRFGEDGDFERVERDEAQLSSRPAPVIHHSAPPFHERPLAQSEMRYAPRRRQSRSQYIGLFVVLGLVAMIGGGVSLLILLYSSQPGVKAEEAAALDLSRHDEGLVEKAHEYLNLNKFAFAIEQLEQLSNLEVKNERIAEVYAKQGDMFYRNDNYEDASNAYLQAIEYAADNPAYHYEVGYIAYRQGRLLHQTDETKAAPFFTEAENQFNEALILDPENVKSLAGLAKVEIARNDRAKAAEYYKRLIQIDANSFEGKQASRALEQWSMR